MITVPLAPTGGGYGPLPDITEHLSTYLQRDVDQAQAELALRIGDGWLLAATGLTQWPVPLPDQLFSWRVELAACAASNPDGLITEQVGGSLLGWAVNRRAEILTAARQDYAGALSSAPLGCFPPALPWPT